MKSPRISVVVDSYNQERFIEQAVVSVLEQDLSPEDFEIIAIDDGSTDRTPEILKKFESRVRCYRKQNGGQASALNAAIPRTSAEFVAFLDGDDWWEKTKLSTILDAFAKHPGVAAVGHGFYEVYGSAPPTQMFLSDKTCLLDLSSKEAARIASLGRTLLGTSRLTVKRTVLDRIGPIPSELVFCADTPILTLSLALGGAVIIDKPLCNYRHHGENLFSQDSLEPAKLRRKADILEFLLGYLGRRLSELNVPSDIVGELFDADEVELSRLRLQLGDRSRWRTLQTEMRDLRTTYQNPSLAYLFFKSLVAVTSVVLSPARFYRLRSWYGAKDLARIRGLFAEANPTVSPSIFQHRPVVKSE